MKILFYDPATPIAYSDATLQERALRGTESTIVRIAHGLAPHHQIFVAQHCRNTKDNLLSHGVNYISFDTAHDLSPDIVVFLRHQRLLDQVVKHFPEARHFFWLHNLPSRDLYTKRDLLIKYGYQIIAVSQFHRQVIEKRLRGKWLQRLLHKQDMKSHIPVKVLYNPIENDLNPDATPINAKQMIFTSSPYKGLPQTLASFAAIRKTFPDYELLIVSPNPLDESIKLPPQVRCIGSLPPHQLAHYIRSSFCVFYPQTERVETFGLVYAEANALGTPVLAHDFGAAREVLSDASQLIDGHDHAAILAKIGEWREHRLVVKAKPEFRLNEVILTWLALFAQQA